MYQNYSDPNAGRRVTVCGDLSEVKLQGVVRGQGDHEASGQVLWQRVTMVAEEQAVIAEG